MCAKLLNCEMNFNLPRIEYRDVDCMVMLDGVPSTVGME